MRAMGDAEIIIAKRKTTREATQLEHRGALALEIIADDYDSTSRRGTNASNSLRQLRSTSTLGAFLIFGPRALAARPFSS
jgi:hypothetical protein